MPLVPFNGVLGRKRAAHLLRRATFIPDVASTDEFANLTAQQAVQRLFETELASPEPPIDTRTNSTWIGLPQSDANNEDSQLQEFFKAWYYNLMLGRMEDGSVSLSLSAREKLVFFLHTYFTCIQSVVDNSRSMYYQNELFRMYARDKDLEEKVRTEKLNNEAEQIEDERSDVYNFKELTKKICVDSAMLKLLDGRFNVKGSPNENFARELFELYSIGRGLEGTLPPTTTQGDYFHFTEQDIQAAARVLSGFEIDDNFQTIDIDTGLPMGRIRGGNIATAHDNNPKVFSHRFDNHVIQADPDLLQNGQATLESVLDEISQLIEMLFSKQETSRHLCRRLYRFYVYYEITEEVENSIISDMVDTFEANNYQLQPLIEALLSSQVFYDALGVEETDDYFGGIIKSPLDLSLCVMSYFKVDVPSYYSEPGAYYSYCDTLFRWFGLMGMYFYEPFDVAGYDAYHQFPRYNRNWISTNYLTNRYDFVNNLMRGMMGDNMFPGVNLTAYIRENIPNAIASNARDLIKELVSYLFPQADNLTFESGADLNAGITAARLSYFLEAFLYANPIDQEPEEAWTFRWNAGVDPETVERQLQDLVNGILQSPEYQLF